MYRIHFGKTAKNDVIRSCACKTLMFNSRKQQGNKRRKTAIVFELEKKILSSFCLNERVLQLLVHYMQGAGCS